MISSSTDWPTELLQFRTPYHSTVAFDQFLARHGGWRDRTEVLDVGCGLGANLLTFATARPEIRFVGFDYHRPKIEKGRELLDRLEVDRVALHVGDVFDMPREWVGRFDGLTCIHTLCVFRRIEPVLDAMIALKPRWIALNSLFHDGPLDVLIHIRGRQGEAETPDDDPDGDFNTFSLPLTGQRLLKAGYRMVAEPFFPPAAMPRPANGQRGTFTMATELSPRTQFSGSVYLPWHFVYAERIEP